MPNLVRKREIKVFFFGGGVGVFRGSALLAGRSASSRQSVPMAISSREIGSDRSAMVECFLKSAVM